MGRPTTRRRSSKPRQHRPRSDACHLPSPRRRASDAYGRAGHNDRMAALYEETARCGYRLPGAYQQLIGKLRNNFGESTSPPWPLFRLRPAQTGQLGGVSIEWFSRVTDQPASIKFPQQTLLFEDPRISVFHATPGVTVELAVFPSDKPRESANGSAQGVVGSCVQRRTEVLVEGSGVAIERQVDDLSPTAGTLFDVGVDGDGRVANQPIAGGAHGDVHVASHPQAGMFNSAPAIGTLSDSPLIVETGGANTAGAPGRPCPSSAWVAARRAPVARRARGGSVALTVQAWDGFGGVIDSEPPTSRGTHRQFAVRGYDRRRAAPHARSSVQVICLTNCTVISSAALASPLLRPA